MGQLIKIAYPYYSKNSNEILLVVDFWNPLCPVFQKIFKKINFHHLLDGKQNE